MVKIAIKKCVFFLACVVKGKNQQVLEDSFNPVINCECHQQNLITCELIKEGQPALYSLRGNDLRLCHCISLYPKSGFDF